MSLDRRLRPIFRLLSHTEALEELRANAGTQFDPTVVETAVVVLAEERRRLQAVAAA